MSGGESLQCQPTSDKNENNLDPVEPLLHNSSRKTGKNRR